MRVRQISMWRRLRLSLIGAIQFGLMYILYHVAFKYLPAFEIALFTVFTPLYIVLIDAALEREWHWRFLAAALLAIFGATIVLDFHTMEASHWTGFLIIQGSNLCFAVGQLLWRREHKRLEGIATDVQLFSLLYVGGLIVCWVVSMFTTDWLAFRLSNVQVLSIVYLGVVASGLCFFWWNVGAEKVNAGTLAVMNNAKMPFGVACSLLIFREKADIPRLILGGSIIILAIWVSQNQKLWERKPKEDPESL
jgi:drug/metabolite transporter (DMT)-like permease